MKNENTKICYYTNDVFDVIQSEVDWAVENPLEAFQYGYMTVEEMYDFIRNYVKCYTHEQETAVKEALRYIDPFDDMDSNKSYDKWNAVMKVFCKDTEAVAALAQRFTDNLYSDNFIVQNRLEEAREYANSLLEEDGFLDGDDMYLIFGLHMGWRGRTGYKMARVNSVEDMENAVTGNYDYTITIDRTPNESWLTACVSIHDAPMGEIYYLIPMKNEKKAMKKKIIHTLMKQFAGHIAEDKEYL